MGDGLLTTQQVAERFDVYPMTVRRWCQAGLLQGAIKVGSGPHSVWLIPPQALESFERPRPGPKAK